MPFSPKYQRTAGPGSITPRIKLPLRATNCKSQHAGQEDLMLARLEMIVRWIPGSCFSARAGRERVGWERSGEVVRTSKKKKR